MPDPTGTITVTDEATALTVTGFDPGARLHVHVEYLDPSGETLFNVDGNGKVKPDGNFAESFGIGATFVEQFSGGTYQSATARLAERAIVVNT